MKKIYGFHGKCFIGSLQLPKKYLLLSMENNHKSIDLSL